MRYSNAHFDLGLFELFDFSADFEQAFIEVLAFEGEEFAELGDAHLINYNVLYLLHDSCLLHVLQHPDQAIAILRTPQVLDAEIREVTIAVFSNQKIIFFGKLFLCDF